MKCPHCGNELNEKNVCSKCMKKVIALQQELEVEYKEFKISEFLEIRKKRKKSVDADAKETPAEVLKGWKEAIQTGAKRPIAERNANLSTRELRPAKQDENKNVFNIVGIILLIIGVIASAFLLLKFLFHQ